MEKIDQPAGVTGNQTRIEQAEARTELAETRTEQAEMALQDEIQKEDCLGQVISTRLVKDFPVDGNADRKNPLEQLTSRQREILQLIAEGKNTKQIADILKVSPKTIEYHRMKLMGAHLRFLQRNKPEGKSGSGGRRARRSKKVGMGPWAHAKTV